MNVGRTGLAWVVVGVFIASCGNAEGPKSSEPTAPFTYTIDPAALTGCRAPNDPGCFRCCVGTNEQGQCEYMEGPDASNPTSSSSYGVFGTQPGACDAACPACAQCTASSEQRLREIQPRPDCDCANVKPFVDPCFSPGGCECYCISVNGALETCPPAPN